MPGPAEALTSATDMGEGDARPPHVLFLAKQFPWPTNVGARQRAFHLVRGLARRHQVTVVALDEPPASDQHAAFLAATGCAAAWCVSTATCRGRQPTGPRATLPVRAWRALRDLLSSAVPDAHQYWWSETLLAELRALRASARVDAVFASQSWMAEHARAAGFEQVVVDVDDLLSEMARQQLRTRGWYPRRPLDVLRAARERAYEQALPARFRGVLVAKPEDLTFFPARLRHRVAVLPNGVDIPETSAAGPGGEDTLLFVGTLGYGPNVDAVEWFVREVLPRIWAVRPDVRFQVVGFGSGAHLAELLDDGRCAVAESPADLTPFYAAAGVVVTPIRTGGGTRIKVLEALAYGRAVVSTSFAPQGLGLQGGTDLELADTPAAMADRCLALLADPARRQALGTAGRSQVVARFDWRRIEAQLDDVMAMAARHTTDRGEGRERSGTATAQRR